MATNARRTQGYLGTGSTKSFSILTTPASQILLDSGFQAMTVYNVGSGNLWVGDSSVTVGSGQQVLTGASKSWDNLQDGWSFFCIAGSNATTITVTEYRI